MKIKVNEFQNMELTECGKAKQEKAEAKYEMTKPELWPFDLGIFVNGDASFFGFSCSVEDGARARIRSFEFDYEHHFIEHEQDFLMRLQTVQHQN